jgi:hypothetical protein
MEQKQKRPKPVLLAMIICDQILREEGTKKISLLGIFNRVSSKTFPCIHPRLHIFVSVTEYEGQADCVLKFSDSTGKEIVQLKGPLEFPDKLAVIEMNFCLNNVPLPNAGIYHFDFIMDNEIIGHRKFKVEEIKEE